MIRKGQLMRSCEIVFFLIIPLLWGFGIYIITYWTLRFFKNRKYWMNKMKKQHDFPTAFKAFQEGKTIYRNSEVNRTKWTWALQTLNGETIKLPGVYYSSGIDRFSQGICADYDDLKATDWIIEEQEVK